MEIGKKRTLLDNRHPEYAKLSTDWRFWKESYNGGADYREGKHLFRFPKETKDNYEERIKRAARLNFTKQVLDLVVQYLSKEAPKRSEEKAGATLAEFWKDVDRQGTKVDDFIKSLATMTGLYGVYYVIVDKPPVRALTRQEQQARKLNPYVYGVSPIDVLDIVFDPETGRITQALIREFTRGDIDLRQARESDGMKERFRLWVEVSGGVEWFLYELDKTAADGFRQVGAGSLVINRVPVVQVVRTGGSLVDDIASLDRKVYNYESLLDQILYDQTFSTLRLPWNGKMEDFYSEWELKLGTKAILPYDPETGVAPDFISPDASQGALIVDAIEKKTGQIYQVKNLQDTIGNNEQSKNNESGVAKGYDFEKLNAGLATFADDMEKAEKAIAELVNLWEGVTDGIPDDLIDYPDSFDVKSLVQELTEYNLLADAVQSDTFRKTLQKGLVKKAAPKLKEAELKEIGDEIDAAANPEEEATKEARNLRDK